MTKAKPQPTHSEAPAKVCNNCGSVYAASKRKCPWSACRSPCYTCETVEQHQDRQAAVTAKRDEFEALLQELVAG